MSETDPDAALRPASHADPKAGRKTGREARLAQALRDNLRRRKAANPPDRDDAQE